MVNSDYMNWPDYQQKFGFCSLGPVKHPIATAFYITKYVSKDLSLRGKDVGKHLYFHSRPLKKAEHASNVYFYNMGKCWELMTSNPLLALCVAAGLLPIGISIFTALRNAARG